MKKTLLPFLLLVFIGLAAQAQNFQPFRKGPTYHYIAQDSIYSLRIDSVKVVAGDSVFVFNPIARKGGIAAGPTCPGSPPAPAMYAVHANNQFGSQMRKTSGGDYYFKTVQGQEFLLKTKATIGQTWIFTSAANLTATLTAKTVETIAATVSDSVYTYSLSNGKTIKLSRNYGFVSTPNFIAYWDAYFKPKDLAFYALPEKGIGQAISSPFAIFDYQPGDEFMYYTENLEGSSMPALCSEYWLHRKILSRQLSASGDTIYYQIQEQRVSKGYGNIGNPTGWCQTPSGTMLHPFTTYRLVIHTDSDSITHALSDGFLARASYSGRVLKGILRPNQFNQREQMVAEGLGYDKCSRTFNGVMHGGGIQKYGVGIGMIYSAGAAANYGTSTTTLIAYKKGTETYGNWVPLSQIMSTKEDLNKKPLIKAFPNPFTSEITLTFGEISGDTRLTLRNTLGQLVWKQESKAVVNSEIKISLPKLANGLYILQASQEGKVFATRLVKE